MHAQEMSFLRDSGARLIRQAVQQARALESDIQKVVEIIAPGPQGTSAKAWDQAKRQASADRVRAAIQNWKAQHQEHDHTAYTRKP